MPFSDKVLLLGCGELGKEVAIELQRFGIDVIATDSYESALAMQVAHSSRVVSMLDGEKLEKIILNVKPDFIVPEVESIATDTLVKFENKGFIPMTLTN